MFDTSPRPELMALLAAVKAEPEDDTAKLVLADWLQEQDDESDRARGEFLREVVRYFHIPPDTPEQQDQVRRLNARWAQHATAWFGPLAEAGFRCSSVGYSHPKWGLLFPMIDGTKVVTKAALAVANSERYAWVAGLYFPRIGDKHLRQFANSPLLDSLIGLSLTNCNAKAGAIIAVVESPRAAGLKSLDLNKLYAPIQTIAWSPHMARLRHLHCWHCHISDSEFKKLCDSPHLNELRSLEVANNHLTIHSARAFAEATGLPALTELNLGGTNRIGPDGTLILVHSPKAAQLRKLNLWSNGIADYGVEALCRQSHVCNLTHLDVSSNLLTNRAAVALAAAEYLKQLEELNLKTNGISGEGALVLANSPHLANLRRLDVSGNRIGEKAAKALRDRFGDRVILD